MDDNTIITIEDETTAAIASIIILLIIAADITIRVLAVIYIPRNRRPQTAMAWLLAIFFIPWVGIILFLLVGSRKLPKKRREKQAEINTYILETTGGMDRVSKSDPWPPWLLPIAELNRELGAMPSSAATPPSCCPTTRPPSRA